MKVITYKLLKEQEIFKHKEWGWYIYIIYETEERLTGKDKRAKFRLGLRNTSWDWAFFLV